MRNYGIISTFAVGKEKIQDGSAPALSLAAAIAARGKSGQRRALHLRNYKLSATVGIRQKKTTALTGKGEKVRQELTSGVATRWLCRLEAASSSKPSS